MPVTDWPGHCPWMVDGLDPMQLRTAVHTLVELGTCFMVEGGEGRIFTTERGAVKLNAVLFPPPLSFDEQLAACSTGVDGNYPNGHDLERLTEPDTEPCWRIGWLAGMRREADANPEVAEFYATYRGGDFPEGLEHGSGCRNCEGSGVQRTEKVVGYRCRSCGAEHTDKVGFLATCCYSVMGPYWQVEEFRAEHEDGEHRYFFRPGCSLCVEQKLKEAREQAQGPDEGA